MFCFKKVVVSESVLKTYTGILHFRAFKLTGWPLVILTSKRETQKRTKVACGLIVEILKLATIDLTLE